MAINFYDHLRTVEFQKPNRTEGSAKMSGKKLDSIFKWAVRTFCNLVQTDAPSGGELKMASAIELLLVELGVEEITRDRIKGPNGEDTANLLAFIPGTTDGPVLGFNAHMDRVEPGHDIKPEEEEDGKIVSSGNTILAADDVAGIVIILAMVKTLRELDLPHPPLQFISTASEENKTWGAKHINRDLIRADMIFSFDGEGPEEIYRGGVASDKFIFEINGRLAHAGLEPENGISAALIAAEGLVNIKEMKLWGKFHNGQATSNFVIADHSKVGTNSVQDRITVRGETRCLDEEYLDDIRPFIFDAFRRVQKEYPGSDVFCRAERAYHAWELKENHPVVQRACKAVKWVGLTPNPHVVPGGVDAAWFNRYGIPSVVLGVGAHEVHSENEKLHLAEFRQAIQSAINLATMPF